MIAESGCVRDWHYERVKGHVLLAEIKKIQTVSSRQQCIELCFSEIEFQCRSANFEESTGQCSLSDMDRHTVLDKRLFQADVNGTIDYLESNCLSGKSSSLSLSLLFVSFYVENQSK